MTSPRSQTKDRNIRRELILGLQHLRSETKEISRMYVANLQRDLVQLIDFINNSGTPTRANLRRLNTTFVRMKETLDEIAIKPEKGRRKDLRRIELAIRSMMKLAFSKNADGS